VDVEGGGGDPDVVLGKVVDIALDDENSEMQHLSVSMEQQACGYLHKRLLAPGRDIIPGGHV